MSVNFDKQQQVAVDVNLGKRVQSCLVKVAYIVRAESQSAVIFVVNQARQALAAQIISDVASVAPRAQVVLANNPTIQDAAWTGGTLNTANVLDTDIEFVLTSEWNSIAGLRPKLDF